MSSVCQRQNNIMSQLLADSGAFLFPCTIEYSLICAAILFIMWKNIAEEHEHYKVHSRRRKISRTLAPPITEHSGTILILRKHIFRLFTLLPPVPPPPSLLPKHVLGPGGVESTVIERWPQQLGRMADFLPPVTFSVFVL